MRGQYNQPLMTTSVQRRACCALLCAALLAARLQAAEPDCPQSPAAPQTDAIGVSAYQQEISVADGSARLRGCVELRYQDRVIRSDAAEFNGNDQTARLPGPFSYDDALLHVEGRSGSYDPLRGGNFSGASFQLKQQPGRGQAEDLQRTPAGALELRGVSYTTCAGCPAAWQIHASRISLNLERQRGLGRGARIEFKGVPIVYIPAISFPLSNQRQTGLLFPTIGTSSRNGASLSVPWYWNLAPNRDITLTPTIYTRRGVNLAADYRVLQRQSSATLRADFLPDDRIARRARSYQQLDAEWRGDAGWRLRLAGENTSDAHYFEDFSQGARASSTTFLPRRAELSWRGDQVRFQANLQHYQTLDQTLADSERPYTQQPRVALQLRHDTTAGWRATLDSELVSFQRRTGTQGWRADVAPAVGWQLQRPGWYFKPAAAWHLTGYRLTDQPAGTGRSPGRSLPIVSVDTGMQLERSARGAGLGTTLEPRLLYVYIPYREQARLPVFDSGLPDPNFVSLYRVNRYVGTDRIGDANRMAVGLTGRLFDGRTGRQYLAATLGQNFNFSTPRVSLPGETVDTRRHSDLIANLDLQALRNWNLRLDLAWDPGLARAQKAQAALQYRQSGSQVINFGYRFDRAGVEQADISAAWTVGRRWEIYGRSVHSLRDRQSIDNFAGLRFKGDCWGLRAVVRRAVSTRAGARETGIYLQFELNGLSSVGTGADTFLRESIKGYSAVDPR